MFIFIYIFIYMYIYVYIYIYIYIYILQYSRASGWLAGSKGCAVSNTRCFQKSIPTYIRQLILYICNREGQVDGFVGGLTSAKRL